ncbi:tRNA (adenosine(37)-N6)-threonylcarbamoyltransferase complex dimerization subunit type 1 TsaB [Porphyrobacter sp. GA68]|uniref:tRNA (adenosine(37)-N6)-threonylcarbamoyltransferase complex dimerization subunit type 1 TsaB n=1 Tax=Porphyrobacter sp. GA68 TaxID=2883480 RepID=UPI001D18DE5C|nr:tRNA (adenosine(37)-N6)-threonylcarbamoyltransferase complex dimerization subunit type 1 TsaB [Porphyrobacter sp. GA68]
MRTLAIDTATEACSVALFDGVTLIAGRHEVLGRGHAERLVPLVAELPDRGRADRIFVSLGPGSFTGTRIGIAAVRALALVWGAEVLGYPTLSLVAACAQRQLGPAPVTVVMNGGHGEWLMQTFDADRSPLGVHHSLPPADAVERIVTDNVAGSKAEELAALRGFGRAFPTLPDASLALTLPAASLTSRIAPIYARAPDAKPSVDG